MYKILDPVKGMLKTFPTYEKANNFRLYANRPDWRIIKKH